jgi:hypothetical protein
MSRFRLATFLFALALPAAAADLRPFPADARLATLSGVQPNAVQLDGQWKQLAPGVQLYDTANRLILPTALPAAATTSVQFEATTGLVARLWLLTPAEAAGLATRH